MATGRDPRGLVIFIDNKLPLANPQRSVLIFCRLQKRKSDYRMNITNLDQEELMNKRDLLYLSLRNQHLIKKAKRLDIVSELCGLQAQFANNPKYALRIRASDYDENSCGSGLIKTWTLRGTMHCIRMDELGLYLSAKGVEREWGDSWWGIPKEVKPKWAEFILAKVEDGVNDRERLKQCCRSAGMNEDLLSRVFHGWGGLIKEMSDRGLIAYDFDTKKRFIIPNAPVLIDQSLARAIIIGRYFGAYGPASVADCSAFTGYGAAEVKRIIRQFNIQLMSIMYDGQEYYYTERPEERARFPACIFLAGFDQLIMGYKDRSRFMDEKNRHKVITCSGIVHPTIILNGRVQARWKMDKNKLLVTPFNMLSKRSRDMIASKGASLFLDRELEIVFNPTC